MIQLLSLHNSGKSRWLLVPLLLLQCLRCSFSQIEGYTNITFESQPQDTYATLSHNSVSFYCRVKGYSLTTSQTELLDIRFWRGSNTIISAYNTNDRYGYLITGEFDTRIGMYIDPIQLSDDGDTFRCQVYHKGKFIDGLVSQTARLTVKDGRPPALPLTEVSTGLFQYTVSWSNQILLPSDGVIYQYIALAYTSGTLVYNTTFSGADLSQYTFTNLQHGTIYQFSIIGINRYGEGDSVDTLLEGTTKTSLVPNPPQSLSFDIGSGNTIITIEPPVVDLLTTAPITQYYLHYYPTAAGASSAIMAETPASNLHFYLSNLQIGTEYTFNVTALNVAGLSMPIIKKYTIENTESSPIVSPTTIVQLTTTTTSTITSSTVLVHPSITTMTTVITTTAIFSTTYTTRLPITTTTSNTLTTTPSQSTQQHTTVVQHATASSSSIIDTVLSTTTSPTTQTTVNNQSTTNEGDLPFNAVVLAIGVIALVIMIAIIVAAVLLVYFCVRSKKDDENYTDFHPSPWTHKAATNPKQKWDSKDSSIKGSPLSSSLNQSISDDIELPIDRNYIQTHTDSPTMITEEDVRNGTKIEAEINLSSTV